MKLPNQVDVVVLGGGLAGHAATLAAADAAASVVLLEKEAETGGSTVLSAGLTAFAGTDEQAMQGIGDSVELLRSDLVETGRGRNDERLVDLYCRHQLETYRWLKDLGVAYGHVHAAAGQSVPRSHPTDTRALLRILSAAAERRGAHLHTGVAAKRLVRDQQSFAVHVGGDSGARTIHAGAVVLATGGFSRNEELLERFAPAMSAAVRGGGAGSQGDGLKMAWQLGAGVIDTPYIKGTYGIYPVPHPEEHGTGILAIYKGAIAVNRAGERFVDESLPYKVVGDASLSQPGATSFQIFDASVMGLSDAEVPIYDFEARERAGLLVVADDLPGLARQLGIPAASLTRTVAEYNAAVTGAHPDPLGRTHLSGGVGTPSAIATPPYYAHPSGTVLLATYCGLTVDDQLRVIDVFDEPIPGLFAAGEVIGGFHGAGYMTGSSIGKAGIFGRLAGRSAASRTRMLTAGASS